MTSVVPVGLEGDERSTDSCDSQIQHGLKHQQTTQRRSHTTTRKRKKEQGKATDRSKFLSLVLWCNLVYVLLLPLSTYARLYAALHPCLSACLHVFIFAVYILCLSVFHSFRLFL